MQGEDVPVTGNIQDTFVLQRIQFFVGAFGDFLVHISPEPLNPLIVNRTPGDVTGSLMTSNHVHCICDVKVLLPMVTPYPGWKAVAFRGLNKNPQHIARGVVIGTFQSGYETGIPVNTTVSHERPSE